MLSKESDTDRTYMNKSNLIYNEFNLLLNPIQETHLPEPTPIDAYSNAYLGLDVLIHNQNQNSKLNPYLADQASETADIFNLKRYSNNSILKRFNELQIQSQLKEAKKIQLKAKEMNLDLKTAYRSQSVLEDYSDRKAMKDERRRLKKESRDKRMQQALS